MREARSRKLCFGLGGVGHYRHVLIMFKLKADFACCLMLAGASCNMGRFRELH